jgi:serine/threonine-protein kinase HipA
MKLGHVEQVAVFYEPAQERRMRVGRLALKDRMVLFEYDAGFLGSKLELSPIKLPLVPGVVVGKPELFDGLMGVFDDSLPDGWGKLLIDRRAAELGVSGGALTPLDRLTLVGARSMGALTYVPEVELEDPTIVRLSDLAKETETVLRGAGGAGLERLIAVGGSPKGARPKVLIQIAPNGDVHFGARTIQPGFTAWLVKFRGPGDEVQSASLEHAYFLMAKAAGITVPRTQLLGKTKQNRGYFAIERFDRDGMVRIHTHTLGGLLHLPHGYPALDYADLLKATRRLTRNEAAVAEMFRRACFNVFSHNRDDHSRNFAFLMDERGDWKPSPAYDLTFAPGPGGQHTMLVAGEGRSPTAEHLLALAQRVDLKHAAMILDEVRTAISRFKALAEEAGVPTRLRGTIASALGLRKR